MTAEEIIRRLGLAPHPEGGFFRETYGSEELAAASGLPARYGAPRRLGTAIYYLVTPESFSALHRVRSDEVFHFYLGDAVEMLQLLPDGSSRVVALGADLAAGQEPQAVVPRGAWQGSALAAGGRFALLGATVAPGFDYADFELARKEELLRLYPDRAEWIERLAPR